MIIPFCNYLDYRGLRQKTVRDMWRYASANNIMLLSDYEGEFWQAYIASYEKYDKLFKRMFASFRPIDQELEQQGKEYIYNIATIVADFSDSVYNHLMINDKKYSEIYRINIIQDSDYSIVDNYNVRENMERTLEKGYTDVYGERKDSTNQTVGARTDNNTTSIGAQTNTSISGIAGFNSSDFSNNSNLSDSIGARQDTSQDITGEQINTSSTDKGAQTDTHNGSDTEKYNLTRIGNIGVKTQTEVMREHYDFWKAYEYYVMIFKDICSELLLV